MIPESKPQGSEQPGRPHPSRNFEEDFQHENGNYLNVCSDCGKQFLGYKRRVTCKLCSLPNPSADEEVETPLVDAAFAEYPVMDTQRGGDAITIQAARSIEKHLRQQHNAEREEFIESAVARDKKADEDRDAYESLINELKAQLEAARTQCALRSAGHDDLRTRLNKANAQKTALYFENSDALAELQQLRASLADTKKQRDDAIEDSQRRLSFLEERNLKFSALQSELATAQRKIERLIEELDWQNKRNSGHPTRGGFEFYINEEWMGLASAAMDGDYGWHASLAKKRFDPDDERVRVRRVIEDDALLKELQTAMEERDAAIRNRDEWRNAATESKQAYDGANSRLEEAEKGITHHRNALMTVRDRQSGSIGIEDLNMGIKHLNALLSRLSTSRETERKTDENDR